MNALDGLVNVLRQLPGVGKKAAQKMALHLLLGQRETLQQLQNALVQADSSIKSCSLCGALDVTDPCGICGDAQRRSDLLCVVPTVADLWALERTRLFKGRYHVLGGLLSALNGVTPDKLRLAPLRARAEKERWNEIIFALPASVEGASTIHHIIDVLKPVLPDAQFTKLAQGLPLGGHMDSMDEGTLALALKGRARV